MTGRLRTGIHGIALAAACVSANRAEAEPGQRNELPAGMGRTSTVDRTPRSFVQDDDTEHDQHQIGMNLRFLGADPAPGGDPIRFAELVLMGVDGLLSFGKLQIHLSGDILPKQPFMNNQPVWQGATVQTRLGLGKHWSLGALASANDLTVGAGLLGTAALGWTGRYFIDEEKKNLALAGRLGGWGRREYGAHVNDDPWVAYAQVGGDVQLLSFSQRGDGAGFAVGTDFFFPVMHDGLAYWAGGVPYDPQTMVEFHLAAYATLATQWDLFLGYSILDNGDPAAPQTTLPIIDGGFDRSQWIFGISYRIAAATRQHTVLFLE